MFIGIATLIALGAVILSFFSTVATWSVLAVAAAAFWLLLLAIRRKQYPHIDDLSDDANALIQRYGHFYFMPFAGSDCSGGCSAICLASIIAVVVSCIRGDWWSLAVGAAVYCATAFAARGFNPTNFLSPRERVAHEEIVVWLQSRMNGAKE